MDIEMLIQYENGRLSDEDTIGLVQEMIHTGEVWNISPKYRKIAQSLIDSGDCQDRYLPGNGPPFE